MKRIIINTPYEDKGNIDEISDKAIQTLDHEKTIIEESITKNEKILIEIAKRIKNSNIISEDANRLVWNVCVTLTIGIILISIFIVVFLVIYCFKNFGYKGE